MCIRRAAGVLKLTWHSRSGRVPTIKLEGELLGPWVGVVCDARVEQVLRSGWPRLDLAAVTFADAAGAELLRDLVGQAFEITACSGFIVGLIDPEHD